MLFGHPLHPEPMLREYVWRWFSLLASGDTASAFALLDEPNSHGILWSPELLETSLHAYKSKGPATPVVTEPSAASGRPHSNIVAFNDRSGFGYSHDLPLNGAWSDLEAQFEFVKRPQGFAVILHDVHVP